MVEQKDTQLTVFFSRDEDGHEYATCGELPTLTLHGADHDELNRKMAQTAETMIALLLRFPDLEYLRKNIRTDHQAPDLPGTQACGSARIAINHTHATLLALFMIRVANGWSKLQAARQLGLSAQNLAHLEAQVLGSGPSHAAVSF